MTEQAEKKQRLSAVQRAEKMLAEAREKEQQKAEDRKQGVILEVAYALVALDKAQARADRAKTEAYAKGINESDLHAIDHLGMVLADKEAKQAKAEAKAEKDAAKDESRDEAVKPKTKGK